MTENDIEGYLTRYCKCYCCTREEALKEKMVQNVIAYYELEREEAENKL